MKGNDGKGLLRRRMTQIWLIVPTFIFLAFFFHVITYVMKEDSSSPSSPPRQAAIARRPRPEETKDSHGTSNFCADFAMNDLVDDDLGGYPRIALLHTKSVGSTFSSNSASETELKGTVQAGEYEYFQVCVAEHKHHHKVSLDLKRDPPAFSDHDYREIDLYISADLKEPTMRTSTWISRDKGNDHIVIPTYVPDFEATKSHTFYVGVHNRHQRTEVKPIGHKTWAGPVDFVLSVSIVDVEVRDMLKRGSLRGGKRILPGQAPDLKSEEREERKPDDYAV